MMSNYLQILVNKNIEFQVQAVDVELNFLETLCSLTSFVL